MLPRASCQLHPEVPFRQLNKQLQMFCVPVCSLWLPFVGSSLAHSPASQSAVSSVKGCRAISGRFTAPNPLSLRIVGVRAESQSEWDPVAAANARRMRQKGLNYSTAVLFVGGAIGATSGGGLSRQALVAALSVSSMALFAYAAWLFTVHNGMVSIIRPSYQLCSGVPRKYYNSW